MAFIYASTFPASHTLTQPSSKVQLIAWTIINAIRRRQMSFAGVVIDKNMAERAQTNNNSPDRGIVIGSSNSAVTHSYSIRVKTAAGATLSYGISSGMYETIKIGDRVSKSAGTTDITILSTNPAAAAPPTAPSATVAPAAPAVIPALSTPVTTSPTPAPAAIVSAEPQATPTPPVDPSQPAL